MNKRFISIDSLNESIKYFENMEVKSPEQLGLFFFFKGIGMNSSEGFYYKKVKEISDIEKKEFYTVLCRMGGIFDENENPGKVTCLFPFSITNKVKRSNFFNGGTEFKSLLSRIRDTIDNTLIDDGKFLKMYNDNQDEFSFVRNYIEILQGEGFLNGNKINLRHFSTWYMRFRAFEIDGNIDDEKLTRVCIKKTCDELNLTKTELDELFIDDRKLMEFSKNQISGENLRSLIDFENSPEVKNGERGFDMNTKDVVDNDYIQKISESIGENISKEELLNLIKCSKQVVLHGAPGTGKSHITNQIKPFFDKTVTIQFHPSMSYEQFIGGYTIGVDGKISSKIGVFLSACLEAIANQDKKYLFVIDEINRGNLSKIFGETILTLDRGYKVQLSQKLLDENNNEISEFSIPENLHIIGTMNSADRSIALVDYAIRRRFAFVKFVPNYDIVQSVSEYKGNYSLSMDKILLEINNRIYKVLKDEDLLLGQSYFMPNWVKENEKYVWTDSKIKALFNYYLIPIIEEYTYGNSKQLKQILGVEISKRISDTDKFMDELKKEFGF